MKRRRILIAALILMAAVAVALHIRNNRAKEPYYFYGRKLTEQYGYINKKGEMVIKPRFWWAGSFTNGIAPATWGKDCDLYKLSNDCKKGFINKKGEVVLEIKFPYVDKFWPFNSEGLAAVRTCADDTLKNCKWGYIDKSGKYVIKPVYDNIYFFSEGLAAVSKINDCFNLGNCEFQFIDSKGNVIIKGPFREAGFFHEGYAPVEICKGNPNYGFVVSGCKWGIINKKGLFTAPPAIEVSRPAFCVSEGLMAAGFWSEKHHYQVDYGYVDTKGVIKITPSYSDAGNFYGGLARVEKCEDRNHHEKCKYGFIDKTGREVIPIKYDTKEYFTDGLIPFNNQVGGCCSTGFMNKSGKIVIEPHYYAAWNFSEGLAAVQKEEKQETQTRQGKKELNYYLKIGYINKSGEYVIKPQPFREADPFSEGLAAVEVCDNNRCD